MSYNPNIPNATDLLSNSQSDLKTNFQSLNSIFGNNHYQFSLTDGTQGKHKVIQMLENSPPSTNVDEGGLYMAVGTNPAETNLFFRAENSGGGGGFQYQLTKANSAQTTLFANNTNYQVGPPSLNGGWTFLPGGLILMYGSNTAPASISTFTYNFPYTFPSAVFSIVITPFRAASSPGSTNEFWVVSGFTTSQFQIFNNGGHSFSFMWMALGN